MVWWLRIKELLTGRWCDVCNRPIKNGWVCDICWRKIESLIIKKPRCFYCQRESVAGVVCWVCRRKRGVLGGLSMFYYRSGSKDLIHRFKYEKRKEVIRTIEKMIDFWWKQIGKEAALVDYWQKNKMLITYVPVSGYRKRWRGFNQSRLIAQIISKVLGLAVWGGIERVKNTPPRVGFSKKERWWGVRGVFEVKQDFQGSGLVVVDDVITSGATVKEVARVLISNKVREVWFLSLLQA